MASSIIFKRAAACVAAAAASHPSNLLKMNKLPLHPIRSLFSSSSSSSSFHSSSIINKSVASSHRIIMMRDSRDDENEDDHRCIISPAKTDLFSSGGGKMESGGEEKMKRTVRWAAKVDEEAVHLRVEIPGVGKENVRVSVDDKNRLKIEGDTDKEEIDFGDGSVIGYAGYIKIPPNRVKLDQVKAAMKNGILRISVPRVKEEERDDIFLVKVE